LVAIYTSGLKLNKVYEGVKKYNVYVASAILGTKPEDLKKMPKEEFEKRWKGLLLP